jgi:hypothetical protein
MGGALTSATVISEISSSLGSRPTWCSCQERKYRTSKQTTHTARTSSITS